MKNKLKKGLNLLMVAVIMQSFLSSTVLAVTEVTTTSSVENTEPLEEVTSPVEEVLTSSSSVPPVSEETQETETLSEDSTSESLSETVGSSSVEDSTTSLESSTVESTEESKSPAKKSARAANKKISWGGGGFYEFDVDTKTLTLSGVATDPTPIKNLGIPLADIQHIKVDGNLELIGSAQDLFRELTSVQSIETEKMDVSQVTNMNLMFYRTYSLRSLDVNSWDTSSVTDMASMFNYVSSLKSLDVSSWDTSSVTSMNGMFNMASGLENLDVSSWDTSSVEDMSFIFGGASNLKKLDVSSWDTSSVKDMSYMFNGARSLESLDVSNWNTSRVENMESLFSYSGGLRSLNLSSWDTSQMPDMSDMFILTDKLESLTLGPTFIFNKNKGDTFLPNAKKDETYTGKWVYAEDSSISYATGRDFMVGYVGSKPGTYIWGKKEASGNWGDGGSYSVTGGTLTLSGTVNNPLPIYQLAIKEKIAIRNIFKINIDNLIVTGSAEGLFSNLFATTTIENSERLNVAGVTSMKNMFNGSSQLTSLNMSTWDTTGVTTMAGMLDGVDKLGSLELGADFKFKPDVSFNQDSTTAILDHWQTPDGSRKLSTADFINYDGTNPGEYVRVEKPGDVIQTGTFGTEGTATWKYNETTKVLTLSGTATDPAAIWTWGIPYGEILKVEVDGKLVLKGSAKSFFEILTMVEVIETEKIDVSRVKSFERMFFENWGLKKLDVSQWNVGIGASLDSMFYNVRNLENLDVSRWQVSNVTDMTFVFSGMRSLKNLDVSQWDVRKVEKMGAMFQSVELESLDFSNWDNSAYGLTMESMFLDARKLNQLRLGKNFKFSSDQIGFSYTGAWVTSDGSKRYANNLELYDYDGSQNTGPVTIIREQTSTQHTITFKDDKETELEKHNIYEGMALILPKLIDSQGLPIYQWYTDKGLTIPYDPTTKVTGDMTIYGTGSKIQVTLDKNFTGATPIVRQVSTGSTLVRPKDPIQRGYLFKGWLNEAGAPYDFSQKVTTEMTLKAAWEKNDLKWFVYFLSDGNLSPGWNLVDDYEGLVPTATFRTTNLPTKEGYTAKLYEDQELNIVHDYQNFINKKLYLFVKWEINTYTVTFDSGDGSSVLPESVIYNNTVDEPTKPTRENHVFKGWYLNTTDTTTYDFSTPITGNITLTARWHEKHEVSFDSDGGTIIQPVMVEETMLVSEPDEPTRTGYSFNHWYVTDEKVTYDFSTPISGKLTLKASWSLNEYDVNFEENGGSEVTNSKVNHGEKITKPIDPTRVGYVFKGWYLNTTDTTTYDFSTPITGNITLTARWHEKHEVSFDSDGGTIIQPVMVEETMPVSEPDEPTRTGYSFNHWYVTDETVTYDFSTPISGKLTLKASWSLNEYDVNFEENGGSEVTNSKVNHGEKVTKPITPTRVGYTFNHWYVTDETVAYDFSTPISGKLTLKASWSLNEYDVNFEENGGSEVTDSKVNHGDQVTKPKAPTRVGYTFNHWYVTDETVAYDFSTPIGGKLTLKASWSLNEYDVNFEENGGSEVTDSKVNHGEKVTKPTAPTREGYVFKGWYTDADFTNPYEFDVLEKGSVTLYAKWKAIMHNVTFDSDNGEVAVVKSIQETFKVPQPSEPKKPGYQFLGWYLPNETTTYDFNSTIQGAIELKAKWEAIIHTVTFDSTGGSIVPKQRIQETQSVNEPIKPTYLGFQFLGWYTDTTYQTKYAFTEKITEPMTLYAKWDMILHTIHFDSDGGNLVKDQIIQESKNVVAPNVPVKVGYKFIGWYVSGISNPYDFKELIKGPITLKAKWEAVMHPVTFNSDGGSVVGTQSVQETKAVSKPTAPTKAGYKFVGWSKSGETKLYDFTDLLSGPLTLKANWEVVMYPVTFDSDGGSVVVSQSVQETKTVSEPTAPTKVGYRFAGWSRSSETKLYDFTELLRGPLSLKANWEAIMHPVTFDSDGGSVVGSQSIQETKTVSEPTVPTKAGYKFLGWYEVGSSELYDFSKPISSAVNLKAKWGVIIHRVSFTNPDGSVISYQEINGNELLVQPVDPTKVGYRFDGWYSDAEFLTAYDFTTAVTEELVIYAKWVPNQYQVFFESNGGTSIQEISVSFEDFVTEPVAPTKLGYDFIGWYTDEALTERYDFDSPIVGDLILYAKWEKEDLPVANVYLVTFETNGGSDVLSQNVEENQQVTEPTNPKKTGYTFTGWYTDSILTTPYDFDSPVTKEITLYAGWKKVSQVVTTPVNNKVNPVKKENNQQKEFPKTGEEMTDYQLATLALWGGLLGLLVVKRRSHNRNKE